MTVASRRQEGQRLLQLLACCEQLREWGERMDLLRAAGRRVAVAYGPDRTAEALELAAALSAPAAPLWAARTLEPILGRDDLMVAVTSAGRPSRQAGGAPSALDRILHAGVVIWGLTGPRPNPVSPYCHDSLAVPVSDPSLLLRSHRLVVRQLVDALRPPAPAPLPPARIGERSRR